MVLVAHGAWTPGVLIYALPSFNVFASSWNRRAIAAVERRRKEQRKMAFHGFIIRRL
jgi:hypothetical protein